MNESPINGARLRALREQAGLKPSELAVLVGCSRGHLTNIESARTQQGRQQHQPSRALAYKILRELSGPLGRTLTLDDVTDDDATEDDDSTRRDAA